MWRMSWYVIKDKIRLTAKTITTTIEHKMDNGIWFQIFMECIVAIKVNYTSTRNSGYSTLLLI